MTVKSNKIFVVAKKEFIDCITSKKFLLIFGIFLLLIFSSSFHGIHEYNENIKKYQNMLDNQAEGSFFSFLPEPKLPNIFQSLVEFIAMIGAILAIVLGYDSISEEKKRGTLKVLLSYPLYRDNVINGKFIGKIFVLILTLGVSLLLATGTILFSGIRITGYDVISILIFFFGSVVYMTLFLGVGMFFSSFAKDDSSALLNSIIVWLVSAILIANFAFMITNIVAPSDAIYYSGGGGSISITANSAEEADKLKTDLFEKMEKRQNIQRAVNIISPTENYKKFSNAVLNPGEISMLESVMSAVNQEERREPTLKDALGSNLTEIILLIVISVILFVATYIVFMRQDIR